MTKEQLGTLILDSERQMYSTAKSMLYSDQDCADAIQETIVKAFSGVHTLRKTAKRVYTRAGKSTMASAGQRIRASGSEESRMPGIRPNFPQ